MQKFQVTRVESFKCKIDEHRKKKFVYLIIAFKIDPLGKYNVR